MDVAEIVLDYLRVLVWPAVAGLVLFWLRAPVKDKIQDLLKVGLGSANAEFAQRSANARLAYEVREQSDTLRSAERESDPPELEPTGEAAEGIAEQHHEDATSTSDDDHPEAPQAQVSPTSIAPRLDLKARRAEARRRMAIEELIVQGADWGREMARLGLDGRPTVEWSESGDPTISYTDVHAAKEQSPRERSQWDEYVQNLEGEVRRIRRELHKSPFTGGLVLAGDRFAVQEELREAEARLRAAHPASGLI